MMIKRAHGFLVLTIAAFQCHGAVDLWAGGPSSVRDGPAMTEPANGQSRAVQPPLPSDADGLPVIAVTKGGARLRFRGLSDIPEPAELRSVYADFAEVHDRQLAALSGARGLRHLTLPGFSGTKPADIGDAALEKIAELDSLVCLSLGTERATDAGVAQLRRLTRLRHLELYAPGASDVGMLRLADLTDLTNLSLRVPRMTDASLARFRALNDLFFLDVCGTSVTGSAFASVARHNDLLLLSGNFSDEGLRVIAQAPWMSLDEIQVVGALATAKGLRHLTGLRSLTRVGLHGTRVTGQEIRELRAKHPGLFDIERD